MRYVGLAGLYRGALQQHHVPEQGTCTNVPEQYCVLYKRGQPCTNGTFYHPCTNHGQDFHQCVLYKMGQPCTIHFQTIYKNSTVYYTREACHVPSMDEPCTMYQNSTSVYYTRGANHVPEHCSSTIVPCTKIALVCTIQEGPTMYHPCTNHVPLAKIALVCTIQEGPIMYQNTVPVQLYHVPKQHQCVLYKRGQPCTIHVRTMYHVPKQHQCVLQKRGQPCTIHRRRNA